MTLVAEGLRTTNHKDVHVKGVI